MLRICVFCSNRKLSTVIFFFFFNDTATTEIYTLSLHDALPICGMRGRCPARPSTSRSALPMRVAAPSQCRSSSPDRSEEHTSELQSRSDLVCRLLLEKKKYHSRLWTRSCHKRTDRDTSTHLAES